MSTKPDYYEVLGLNKADNPNGEQINRALQRIVMLNHPDALKRKAGVTEAQLKEAAQKTSFATEAAKVLNDAEKRAIYDKEGHAGLDRLTSSSSAAPTSTAPKVEFTARTSDETADFFLNYEKKGGGGSARRRRRGGNSEVFDEVAQDDAVTDFTVELSLNQDPEHGRQASISLRREVTTHTTVHAETGDPVRDAFYKAAARMREAANILEQAALRDVVPLETLDHLVSGLEQFTAETKSAVQQARRSNRKP